MHPLPGFALTKCQLHGWGAATPGIGVLGLSRAQLLTGTFLPLPTPATELELVRLANIYTG